MKSIGLSLSLAFLVMTQLPAFSALEPVSYDGTYKGEENSFVSIKKMTFSKSADGQLKVQGWLVGFPEDVPLGEAVAEPYEGARSRGRSTDFPPHLLATFNSSKVKAVVMIKPGGGWGASDRNVGWLFCDAFVKNPDGSKTFIDNAQLKTDKKTP